MKPDPNYRENHKRALYLTGEITADMVDRLTPRVHELREILDPITVYINSPGGEVAAADRLRNLIQMPDQDGITRRLITVVTDEAASAAADFWRSEIMQSPILVPRSLITAPAVPWEV